MSIDYRERRPGGASSVNRPRRQGGGKAIVFVILLVLVIGYCGGLATGWFLFRKAVPEALQAVQKKEAATQVAKVQPPVQAQSTSVRRNTPLTFYETLPKGKVVLGTGLNPAREEAKAAAPHPQPQPGAQPVAAPVVPKVAAVPPVSGKEPQPQQGKQGDRPLPKPVVPESPKTPASKGKYAVQLASYQVKKEAEELKGRLTSSGFAAYIVESEVAGKGRWYRVRVGKSLDVQAANELAARVARGAVVVLE